MIVHLLTHCGGDHVALHHAVCDAGAVDTPPNSLSCLILSCSASSSLSLSMASTWSLASNLLFLVLSFPFFVVPKNFRCFQPGKRRRIKLFKAEHFRLQSEVKSKNCQDALFILKKVTFDRFQSQKRDIQRFFHVECFQLR